jgi:hypothetical protein
MNEPYVASSKVITALRQEVLQRKARAEDILEPTSVALAKTKSTNQVSGQETLVKHCTFCNVDGHDLNNCFNTAKVIRDYKSCRAQKNDNGGDLGAHQPKKSGKQPKPTAKAGRTSFAQLGGSHGADKEESDYSGLKIGFVSHQAVCLLSTTFNPRATGNLNLDLGCSMTMLPHSTSLVNLRDDNTSVNLANQLSAKPPRRVYSPSCLPSKPM